MKRIYLIFLLACGFQAASAQPGEANPDTSWKKIYRATPERINDLIHTKLDVKFDYSKSWMLGKAWITLKPHFYATDSLTLDAKGMDIKEISVIKGTTKKKLDYKYLDQQLFIKLDKTYKASENYTVYIDYTAKPDELEVQGSAAITDAKGLYFINPKGEDKEKPVQIWTQGETEGSSVWFPTIDKPGQKTTDEIYMTVPSKYVTLSNGLLISSKKNTDGTRTDYWKMDQPHAPYLFFMGVGDFAIIKDSYKGKEVNYYVEPKEAPYARAVFGRTPEMMKFFSEKLGVEYPWAKYAQIVGRDYVSGAMENTTATLHQESAYQNFRELVDGNDWEETIAHELFHQWFGDLVTTESWSNLTLNESFANYSEYLWMEYKKGKDAADEHHFQDMQGYLQPGNEKKDLVRFHYSNREDMFDGVSYNKGGRILNMLRNFVGDEAFFKSLNLYLTTHKFKSAEAHNLRLAFEEVTGKDLNWFFNQWYFGSGHPKLKISYEYNDTTGKALVIVEQTQKSDKIFRLPVAVDVYTGANKVRHQVWLENRTDTLQFDYKTRPDLINVDADKVILCEKTDNKTAENFIHQYSYAPNYLDRREALDYFSKKSMPELLKGLNDRYYGLRAFTVNRISSNSKLSKDATSVAAVEKLVSTESNKKVLAAGLTYLGKTKDAKYSTLFNKYASDSSYSVAGAALEGLTNLEPEKAYELARKFAGDAKGALGRVVNKTIISKGTEADFDIIASSYKNMPPSQDKLGSSEQFGTYLEKVNDVTKLKKGIDYIISFRNMIPEAYRNFTDPTFKKVFDKLSKSKGKEIEEYIQSVFK